MTLTFRGQAYEVTSTEIASLHLGRDTELTGKYRGVSTCLSTNRSADPTALFLTYRGIAYRR